MKALVIVDMQNDFIDGALGTPEAVRIVPTVAAKLANAREEGTSVIFTRDTHGEDYLHTEEGRNLPVQHCIKGTKGWEITDALDISDSVIIDKPSFGSVELGEYLRQLAPESIEIVGLCTDICVISNALLAKAFLPETPIYIDASCCAGVTPESHKGALAAMQMCQIKII